MFSLKDRSSEIVVEQVGRQRSPQLVAINILQNNLLLLFLFAILTLSVLLAGFAFLRVLCLSFFGVQSGLLLCSLDLVLGTSGVF